MHAQFGRITAPSRNALKDTRGTRTDGKFVSTSMARIYRLKSSSILNVRNRCLFQAVTHKGNRPTHVRDRLRFKAHGTTRRQTLLSFSAQMQIQISINFVCQLIVSRMSSPMQQDKIFRESISWIRLGQLEQFHDNRQIILRRKLIYKNCQCQP